jgi:HPt (histidine-containing phosphotransfer) domain-containing protein
VAVDSMLESLRAHLPPERVERILQRFQDDAEALVQEMHEVIDEPTTLGRTVHRLRGKSLVVGADALASLCADLERHPAADDRQTQITAIGAEIQRLKQALAD